MMAPPAAQGEAARAAVAAVAVADKDDEDGDGTAPQRVRRLRFEQGGAAKFWQVALNGSALTVRFGRLGSQGQSQLKQCETIERAAREMDKLVDEKLRKGYVEDGGA